MPNRLHPNLAAKYYGPFPVGLVAFKLHLLDKARIHPMFHVSQLKLAVGPDEVQPELRYKDQREIITQ